MILGLFRRLTLLPLLALGLRAQEPVAQLFLLSDQHSSYAHSAQIIARIDALLTAQPDLPAAVLINGDLFEAGNPIARRTAGELDLAFLRALTARLPVIFNLGNHDAEFSDLPTAIAALQAAGATVISNLTDHAFTNLPLGPFSFQVLGLATPALNTYPAAIRDTLNATDPVAWTGARRGLLTAPCIVLSHAGVEHDRELLPLLPPGTLLLGGHNHLRFTHRDSAHDVTYVHVGCWNEALGVATLTLDADQRPTWTVRSESILATDPVDAALATAIATVTERELTAADRAIVGQAPAALSPGDAARLAVAAVREATGADAAFIGNTTFGAGLAAGPVAQIDFDAWVRFDGTLCTTEITGAQLAALLTAANPDPDTPFAARRGEFLYAVGPNPAAIDPHARYRIATNDWAARNSARYFDLPDVDWQPHSDLKLKATAAAQLAPAPQP